MSRPLPIPGHFDPEKVGSVWRVDYQQRAIDAKAWAKQHKLQSTSDDSLHVALLLIDVQNTFCMPDFELFVAGQSGDGAVVDNQRLCGFIYQNLNRIGRIHLTMDSHRMAQIFHPFFWVDDKGDHPEPYTQISSADIAAKRWQINPRLRSRWGFDENDAALFATHYTGQLEKEGKFQHTIWPYHAMVGGIGHALVPAIEEAVFFHGIARDQPPEIILKGEAPLTENYSALAPEVMLAPDGTELSPMNLDLIDTLLTADRLIVAGQAKSHCVAWTLEDLLDEIEKRDSGLAQRVYLLEDCTSPVVIPDVIDYSESADKAFERFAEAGMHRVSTKVPMEQWPGIATG